MAEAMKEAVNDPSLRALVGEAKDCAESADDNAMDAEAAALAVRSQLKDIQEAMPATTERINETHKMAGQIHKKVGA